MDRRGSDLPGDTQPGRDSRSLSPGKISSPSSSGLSTRHWVTPEAVPPGCEASVLRTGANG